jgi:uncharacterized protein YkwD
MRIAALLSGSAVICCCAVLAAPPAWASASSSRLDAAERKVIRLVNRIRARHGLRRLRCSRVLARAATAHSSDMLRRDFFAHTSSDGTPMDRRLRRYTRARWVGENIGVVSTRGSSAARIVRMWMRSPGHRSVILSRASRRVGVGKRTGSVGSMRGAVYTLDLASRR